MRGAARAGLAESFFRRAPTPQMVMLTSPAGRALFEEAARTGELRMFYRVCGHTPTQRDPSSCAPTSVVCVLNLLEIDPQRQWKGIWRWHDEDSIRHAPTRDSWTLLELADILRNNEVSLRTFLPDVPLNAKVIETQRQCIHDATKDRLFRAEAALEAREGAPCPGRQEPGAARGETSVGPCVLNGQRLTLSRLSAPLFHDLLAFLTRRDDMCVLANYHRAELGQTGEGHYSPVSAYNSARRLLLISDLAKFKYGYHWVSAEHFFAAMSREDPVSHTSRGLVIAANRMRVEGGRLRGFQLRHGLQQDWRRQLQGAPGLAQTLAAPFFAEFAWKYALEREMARDEDAGADALYAQLHADSLSADAGLQRRADELVGASPALSRLCAGLFPAEHSSFRLLLLALAARLRVSETLSLPASLREELDYILGFYFGD